MEANAAAFARCRIVPRVLRDVEKRDLSIELFPGGLARNLLSREPREAVRKSWDNLEFSRRHTRRLVLLKGILHPEDARKAIEHGIAGIMVSNHGGRQVDGAIASLDALPGILGAAGGRIPVLLDNGVRGGADAFKALALGAAAVCLGRPHVYGLAVAGEQGVREVVGNVLAELDLSLGLAGHTSVRQAGPAALTRNQ
jgi:lactate 2-monooxygenase